MTVESRQPERAEAIVNNVGYRRQGGQERVAAKRPAMQNSNRAVTEQRAVNRERSVASGGQEDEEDARAGTQDRGTHRHRYRPATLLRRASCLQAYSWASGISKVTPLM